VGELFGFGKWVLIITVMTLFLTQGVDIFVGKVLGVTALAYYQMAYRISNLHVRELGRMLTQVTLPAYAHVQDDLARLQKGFLGILELTMLIVLPASGLMFALAEDLTRLFLGTNWLPIVPVMQILAIVGAFTALTEICNAPLMAINRPEVFTRFNFWKLLILAVLIWPFTHYWGLSGAAWALLVSSFLILPFLFHIAIRRELAIKPSAVIKATGIPLLVTVLISVGTKFVARSELNVLEIACLGFAALACFIFAVLGLDKLRGGNLRDTIRTIVTLRRTAEQTE
jgi:O-antigen/teichoic acid export membrane protein